MAGSDWTGTRRALVRAVEKGDQHALRIFFDEHYPAVYRYVLCRVGRSAEDAEEIVGDVFFQAFRDARQYDGRRPVGAWLLGIARHRVLDFYRRQGRRPVVELAFSRFDGELARVLADLDGGELPDAALQSKELGEIVEVVLSALPEHYTRLLRLRYVEEKPVKDAAAMLGLSLKAAEMRLARAREAFREAFRLAAKNMDYETAGNGA